MAFDIFSEKVMFRLWLRRCYTDELKERNGKQSLIVKKGITVII
ncbi:MAG: hypothetical protein OEZ30_05100 [Candidatus Aminicenantes bacterium]|nr:hypothetical protein [Candidatus Aminicenantes bacterium]